MKRILLAAVFVVLSMNMPAWAAVSAPTYSVNGSSGPFEVPPGAPFTVGITATVDDSGGPGLPVEWNSTEWEYIGGTLACVSAPDPSVVGTTGGVEGTATIEILAPLTEGAKTLVFLAYQSADCTGRAFVGLDPLTINVVAPLPVAPAAPVPTISGFSLASLALVMLALGAVRLRRSVS